MELLTYGVSIQTEKLKVTSNARIYKTIYQIVVIIVIRKENITKF